MSETPGEAEHYTPPPDQAPPPVAKPAPTSEGTFEYTAPPKRGLATTSLALGIVATVTGWIPWWGIAVGAAAVVFGAIALAKGQRRGTAISGIVWGALGIAFSALVIAIIIADGT